MDLKLISELIKMMEGSKLSSMELEWKDIKLKLSNNSNNDITSAKKVEPIEVINNNEYATTTAVFDEKSVVVTETESLTKSVNDSNARIVKSPMVGTFYASASPESATYVSVGSMVKKGATLCIIEAMKLMNEIESEEEGTIIEILAKNGDLVEYGQPLFKII